MAKLTISLLVFFGYSSYALADCGVNKNAVVFANGMFNDRPGAYRSVVALSSKIPKEISKNKISEFVLAYNTNEFALTQVHQVFVQKLKTSGVNFWDSFAKVVPYLRDNDTYRNLQFLFDYEVHDKDLKEQIQKYESLLSRYLKVIVVSHSQGNMYTNRALFHVENPNKFEGTSVISVATPIQSDLYFTFKSDHVIRYIPGAAEPNLEKGSPGYFDHEFVGDYLADDKSRRLIVEAVVAKLAPSTSESDRDLNPFSATYNSDLNKQLVWFIKKFESDEDWTDAECYLAEALFYVASVERSCTKNSREAVTRSLSKCVEGDFKQWGQSVDSCPFNGSALMTIRLDYPSNYMNFATGKRDVCNYSWDDIEKKHKKSGSDALSLLKKIDSD